MKLKFNDPEPVETGVIDAVAEKWPPAAAQVTERADQQPMSRPMVMSRIPEWGQQHSQTVRRLMLHHILHTDDPPHRLALGAAIGIFIAFTPTVGFQMMIVVFLAWLLRANKAIGVPLVWISNPLTIPPIFFCGYTIGRLLLGWEARGRAWWVALATPPDGWWDASWYYWSRTIEIAGPLWLGCILLGLLAAIPTYFFVLKAICKLRAANLAKTP